MFKRYKRLAILTIVCVLLFVPFVLRTVAPYFEPYPAIIFPSGAMVASTQGETIQFSRVEYVGFDAESGDEVVMDIDAFFSPIPPHFVNSLSRQRFGLDGEDVRNVYFKYVPLEPVDIRLGSRTPEEVEAVKGWFRKRLDARGCETSRMIVRRSRVTFNIEKQEIVDREVTDEDELRFD